MGDSLNKLKDTMHTLSVHLDTVYYKMQPISDGKDKLFTTENPIWYILTLIVSGLIAYYFSSRQKKSESITEAKKIFLEKRIEKHNELYKLFSKAHFATGLSASSHSIYHKIFETYHEFMDWIDVILNFTAENRPYLSKNVLQQLSILNNLRKHIDSFCRSRVFIA